MDSFLIRLTAMKDTVPNRSGGNFDVHFSLNRVFSQAEMESTDICQYYFLSTVEGGF
jgi:hypothetical protein